jgi:hypothetical protein
MSAAIDDDTKYGGSCKQRFQRGETVFCTRLAAMRIMLSRFWAGRPVLRRSSFGIGPTKTTTQILRRVAPQDESARGTKICEVLCGQPDIPDNPDNLTLKNLRLTCFQDALLSCLDSKAGDQRAL